MSPLANLITRNTSQRRHCLQDVGASSGLNKPTQATRPQEPPLPSDSSTQQQLLGSISSSLEGRRLTPSASMRLSTTTLKPSLLLNQPLRATRSPTSQGILLLWWVPRCTYLEDLMDMVPTSILLHLILILAHGTTSPRPQSRALLPPPAPTMHLQLWGRTCTSLVATTTTRWGNTKSWMISMSWTLVP